METVYDGNTTIGCEPGYEFGGTATCLATGLWDELTMPTCDPVGECFVFLHFKIVTSCKSNRSESIVEKCSLKLLP